jgi:3D (Asp-Asp-Asp) domain-containing protein
MKQGEALSDSGGLRAEVSAGVDFDGLSGNLMAADRRESLEMESDGEQETAPSGHSGIREQSFRSGNIRGHPSGTSAFLESAAETSHLRKKKLVQEYARKASGKPEDTAAMEDFREEIKEKTKREQLRKEQKKAGRLSFGDEESGMVRGAGMGISKKAVSTAAGSAAVYVHGKAHEAEQENAAVEGTHRAELMAESALRYAMHRTSRGLHKRNARLQEAGSMEMGKSRFLYEKAQEAGEKTAEQAKKGILRKFWQKRQYQKAYRAAKKGEKTAAGTAKATQTIASKARSVASAVIGKNKGILGIVAAAGLFFVMIASLLASCGASIQGGAASTIASTTYGSTDEDIYAVEDAYSELEAALNEQINSMESRHPGYDEYRYQIDEISHNPYHLISYFSAKYGEFTYEQVKDEIEEIFQRQYSITTESTRETVTETKMVRVGESLGQVVTSGYCSCSICCGQWAGGPTASGVYPTANHTIAVDASNPFVPMGTKVIMNGVEYVVEDTGAFARYGVQFDVYYSDHAAASAHGHQTWEAYLADDNGNQEVEVTTTQEVNRLDVTLTNHGLDAVLRELMDENEEGRYDLYNSTYGNRDYLFDTETLPGGGDFGYEIPAEALTDQKFANMIHEAEKYLGYPYVWGGSSPSTSFDCSGFVSWVINNCGNGWNIGRQTTDGLMGYCSRVSPSEAKPGDLIFFQGTYDTAGASHVGIYVGDNMMIHCGNPIQYTSIASSYWQEHFLAFGRIHG